MKRVSIALLGAIACSDGSGPAARTATRLAFTTEPVNAVADTAIPATIRVSVLDQSGAVLTDATSAITLALGANPGSAVLSGGTTANAVAGVASFTGIILDKVGTGYTLVATSAGLTQATSAMFNVTLSLNDADGDTFSPNAGDCNDASPAIHPGATDLPDAAYGDTNCDGTDGERANATFVSPTGTGGTCGTEASPCATVQQGIDRAVALGRRDVYVARGSYGSGSFTLANGVNVFGGFDAQYHRAPANIASINGRSDFPVDGGTQAITVFAADLTAPTVLADLTLVGANASGLAATGQGKSAHVIVVRNVAAGVLTIARNVIIAGNGSSGGDGAAGSPAASLSASANGGPGGNANEFSAACEDDSRGAAGTAGVEVATAGTATRGGAGGAGGTMDNFCSPSFPFGTSDFTATSGVSGAAAAVNSPGFGIGGPGGAANICAAGGPGLNGLIRNGAPGQPGGTAGFVDPDFWLQQNGTDGGNGFNGGGGGGGGGSGGCDLGIDSYGAGGGGGGSGGLAAQGGRGGGGGGGSFGIYLIQASPTIENNTITRGSGGVGGRGGAGGQGQSGGQGGLGGLASGDSQAGGRGGNGAHGGHGGGGGGGTGGISYGIYRVQGSTPTITANTIGGGAAGPGGPGGASAPNAPTGERDGNTGFLGAFGVLGTVGSCAAAGSC